MANAPTPETTGRFCEQFARSCPQISPAVVITTRVELEIMLLRAFEQGMHAAEATIKDKLRTKVLLPGWENT